VEPFHEPVGSEARQRDIVDADHFNYENNISGFGIDAEWVRIANSFVLRLRQVNKWSAYEINEPGYLCFDLRRKSRDGSCSLVWLSESNYCYCEGRGA
jgi:hypothetical protein